jgi:hypothetical protein
MPLLDTPTATQFSQVILHVTAPAFLLGAVAAFASLQKIDPAKIRFRNEAFRGTVTGERA